jgi:hypothetical protein
MIEKDQYRCAECGVEFSSSEQLEQHSQKEHHSEPQRAGQRQSREGNSQTGPQRVRPSDRQTK